MDNKGFTLIELVVTISLLSIIGVVIATNMVSLQSKQMAKNYEVYKQKIADAACTYIESDKDLYFYKDDKLSNRISTKKECLNNGGCYINAGNLITQGYLEQDLENPATGKKITDSEIVKIYFEKGIKTCEYIS